MPRMCFLSNALVKLKSACMLHSLRRSHFGIFRISFLFLRQLSGALLSSDHSSWQYLYPFTKKTLCLNADFRLLILRLMAFFKQCIHCQCKVLKGRKSFKLKKGRNLQKNIRPILSSRLTKRRDAWQRIYPFLQT